MATLTLKNGMELHAKSTTSVGVTENCGMNAITGVNIYAICPLLPGGFSSGKLSRKELDSLVNQHWEWVYASIKGTCSKGLIVLSDRMLYQGMAERRMYWNTGDFIRELVRRKIGTIIMSPLISNLSYREGEHDIQACFWIPPEHVPKIVAPTSIVEGSCIGKSRRKKVVAVANYEEWWNRPLVIEEQREEWMVAPIDMTLPKHRYKAFFNEGMSIKALADLYNQGVLRIKREHSGSAT